MVKKKQHNFQDDDSEKACTHMGQGINITRLRKGLREFTKHGQCQKCEPTPAGDEAPCIYVCLQCGHQGCDRSTRQKHALRHYEMAKTHFCAINVETLQIWCYKCDDFKSSGLKTVQDCSDLIYKLFKAQDEPVEPVKMLIGNNEASSEKTDKKSKVVSTINSEIFPKVKGLSNLGNTCFFNSIMQSINQTYLFEQQLKKKDNSEVELNIYSRGNEIGNEEGEINSEDEDGDDPVFKKKSMKVKLAAASGMTKNLLSFYEDMRTNKNVVSPGTLFGSLCSKAPQFKGFQQQDSHELLRCLLDGIREEEIKKLQSGILDAFNVSKDVKSLTDLKKKQIKAFGRSAKHTAADEVFGGCFLSTVTCEECQTPHQIYESFLDISLPIISAPSSRLSEKDSEQEDLKYSKKGEKGFYKKNASEEKVVISKNAMKKERKNAKKLKKQTKKSRTKKSSCSESNEHQDEKNDENTKDGDDEDDDEEDGNNDCGDENVEDEIPEEFASMNLIGGKVGDAEANHVASNHHRFDEEGLHKFIPAEYDIPLDVINGDFVDIPPEDEINYFFESAYEKKLHAMKMATTELGERTGCHPVGKDHSVVSSLHRFTSSEMLVGCNKYICDHCNKRSKGDKRYTLARRQILIYAPPAILTLHLKRFQQTSTSLKKLDDHINFEEILDLAPYCSSLAQNVLPGQTKVLYSLYAVVEHSGSMRGGHYTAYIKVREDRKELKKFIQTLSHENFNPDLLIQLMKEKYNHSINSSNQKISSEGLEPSPGRWFHVSDSHVSEVKDIWNVLNSQAYVLFYERIL